MESDAANVHHPDDGRKESVGYNSNVQSRHQQKAKIKKEYTAATTGFKSSEESVKATQRAAEGARKTREFVSRHKKGFAVLGILAAFILLLSTIISSCSVLVDGLTGTVGGSTYPVEDSDMQAAEAAKIADVWVTVTGDCNVIDAPAFENLKDGAILCNSGHFDSEINLRWLEEHSESKQELKPLVEEYTLTEEQISYMNSWNF